MEGGSGFNVCVPNFAKGFGVCAWNARAFAHHNPTIRKQKLRELSLLLKRFEVVIILEAHGSDDLFEQILKQHSRSHTVFSSFCCDSDGSPKSDTGGILIFCRKTEGVAVYSGALAQGRILEIVMEFDSGRTMSICCVHNYDTYLCDLASFEAHVKV